jgi:hypothetical protein
LHLVGYLYYWQMGFNSVFKGLILSELVKCLTVTPTNNEKQRKYLYVNTICLTRLYI